MNHNQDAHRQIQQLQAALASRDAQIASLKVRIDGQSSLLPADTNSDFVVLPAHGATQHQPSPLPVDLAAVNDRWEHHQNARFCETPGFVHHQSQRMGVPMMVSRSSMDGHRAPKRYRTMSQQLPQSHQMNRNASSLSAHHDGPFEITKPITPPPHPHSAQPQSPEMPMYWGSDAMAGGPADLYMRRSLSTGMVYRRDTSSMPTVNESVMMEPGAFIATLPLSDDGPDLGSTLAQPFSSHSLSNSLPYHAPRTVSVCDSLTTAPTVETSPMSRSASGFDYQSVTGAVDMMNLSSHQGFEMSQSNSQQFAADGGETSPLGKRTSSDQDLIGLGSSLLPPGSRPYPAAAQVDAHGSADMERSLSSVSMASSKSSSSWKVRAAETLKRQNDQGRKIALKPKPVSKESVGDAGSSSKKANAGKTAITKTKYVRPNKPKVFCDFCDEQKDGFRGEHELRRHCDAKHPSKGTVKKYMCVTPTDRSQVKHAPVTSLDKCKACRAQKQYGAYYNAAAHLRRTHFKEKPSRAKKTANGSKPASPEDKRGGKGGGDWPPMDELKHWMKEIVVHNVSVAVDGKEVPADADRMATQEFSPYDGDDCDNGDASVNAGEDWSPDEENELEGMEMDESHQFFDHPAHHYPSGVDFDFSQGGAPPIMNTDLASLGSQPPISSAGFVTDWATSTSFCETAPMYGSVMSSNETLTPSMMQGFQDMDYNDGHGLAEVSYTKAPYVS